MMLMRPYSDLVDQVSIHLEHCPRVAIIDSLRHVAIEFCRRTGCWVESLTLESPANEAVLQADLPLQSRICRTLQLSAEKDSAHAIGDVQTDGTIVLDEPFTTDTTLYLRVSLAPSTQSLDAPEVLFEDWADAMVSGAVARLQMQPGREWSQPNMAAAHQQRFEQGIDEAKTASAHRSMRTGRVRPNWV